jgi:hypothetical protein
MYSIYFYKLLFSINMIFFLRSHVDRHISNMAVIASFITPDHIYMFLQLSKRWFENESFNQDFVCYSILQLTLFSLLYNLIFVASVVSTQPRRKKKNCCSESIYCCHDLLENCCYRVLVIYQSSSVCWSDTIYTSLSFHEM